MKTREWMGFRVDDNLIQRQKVVGREEKIEVLERFGLCLLASEAKGGGR